MNSNETDLRGYLKYLPSIYSIENSDPDSFIVNYLKIFEKILTGINDSTEDFEHRKIYSLSYILSRTSRLFNHESTPQEFVDWLASSLGLLLKQNWTLEKKRQVIGKILGLYRMRGTKRGLEEYIRIYVGEDVPIHIYEFTNALQISESSTIGNNTIIGEGRPFYFGVHVLLPVANRELLLQKRSAIIEIIEREKPAHTYYSLTMEVPTLQIGKQSTIGIDTVLGGGFVVN